MQGQKESKIVHELLRGNDREVLNYLYKSCLPKIKSLVSKLGGNMDDAKDVFQDGVVIMYRKIKLGDFLELENPDAFLYTICRNIWLNKMKKDSKMMHVERMPDRVDDQADIQRQWDMKEREAQLMGVFEKLGDKCARLLRFVYIKQLKPEVIALELEMASTDVVKTAKNRCKNKLQDLIQEHPQLVKILTDKT